MNDPTPDRGRARFPWLGVALFVLALAAAALGGFAWHYSDLILDPRSSSTLHEQRVLAAGPDWVRLSRDHESLEPGTWALQWEEGYGRIERVRSADDSSVVREFHPVVGRPPVGGWASLRGVSRSADPRSMLGIAFDTVAVEGPLGSYPAWFVPGRGSTWVLFVHGRGANRAEGLRTLGVLAQRELPGLMVTYRNDAGAPASRDGFTHLGLTEWQDLEAAARWALGHGARDLVLCGYSMGGQIVMQFLSRSRWAASVRAVVLESPVLSWDATFERRAQVLGVPPLMTWLGERVATARAGLDWGALDRVARTPRAGPPILVLHGVKDSFAPEPVSEAFARALPERVTLVRVASGNHVEAWNADPAAYAAALGRWLDAHGIGARRAVMPRLRRRPVRGSKRGGRSRRRRAGAGERRACEPSCLRLREARQLEAEPRSERHVNHDRP